MTDSKGYKFHKYLDEKSMLVLKRTGTISRIFCPFAVVNDQGEILTVCAISQGEDGFPYYLIDGHYYRYSIFLILPK